MDTEELRSKAREILYESREGVIGLAETELCERINFETIAKLVFGQNKEWLKAKLEGNFRREKESGFSDEEANALSDAFADLGNRLLHFANKITHTPPFDDEGEEELPEE